MSTGADPEKQEARGDPSPRAYACQSLNRPVYFATQNRQEALG